MHAYREEDIATQLGVEGNKDIKRFLLYFFCLQFHTNHIVDVNLTFLWMNFE